MRVIIAGSRSIKDRKIVEEAIEESGFSITEIICGAANGVDTLGEEIGKDNNIPVKYFPALWDDLTLVPCVIRYNKYGKPYNALAGHNRNEEMAKYADALVAVWDGASPGTKNMIGLAKKYHLKIYVKKVK